MLLRVHAKYCSDMYKEVLWRKESHVSNKSATLFPPPHADTCVHTRTQAHSSHAQRKHAKEKPWLCTSQETVFLAINALVILTLPSQYTRILL